MSKSRKHVSRRVKGVILGRDSAGLPVDIHIDSGPQQISQRHTLTNRRYENLYCCEFVQCGIIFMLICLFTSCFLT